MLDLGTAVVPYHGFHVCWIATNILKTYEKEFTVIKLKCITQKLDHGRRYLKSNSPCASMQGVKQKLRLYG